MSYLPGGGRGLYLPNGRDVWGFDGSQVEADTSTNTDTGLPALRNLRTGGYTGTVVAPGAVAFGQANPVANRRARVAQVSTATTANAGGSFAGCAVNANPATDLRLVNPAAAAWTLAPYTKLELEALVSLNQTGNVQVVVGFVANAGAPVGAGNRHAALVFDATVDATLWRLASADGSTWTTPSMGVAIAANTIQQIYVSWDGTTLTARVNGTQVARAASVGGVALLPAVGVWLQAPGSQNKVLSVEELVDRWA